MAWEIVFAPSISSTVLWVAAIAGLALTGYSLWERQRGVILRALALAFIILTLANPTVLQEERDPISDVVALVIDQSASQKIGERDQMTTATVEKLKIALSRLPGLEVREIYNTPATQDGGDQGTTLFSALESGLIDVPPERIAGAIIITDGQVHDTPEQATALGFEAPVHALITGRHNESDRKLTVERAPRFGIVGETVTLTLRVDDFSGAQVPERRLAEINVRVDGKAHSTHLVVTGMATDIDIELTHGGQNVVELEVSAGSEELTKRNNRAVVLMNGIRDHLRVLLVSGEPHAGERTWRNLLKADPSVDLVHFTILRPPEKQDGTPIGELSLIEFPTRQLFSVKLNEFDLIIFDRYRRRGVLPLVYLDNVAKFVENGGALLTAAGPAFASPYSLFRTPLAAILPGQPTGDTYREGFKPMVTDAGFKHPITASLPGAQGPLMADGKAGEPTWGRWFRLIDTVPVSGQTLMSGTKDRPLLIVDRVGDGRVAQLMSDHAWLWSRGYQGGGPHAEILRRLAHWLMKEPDLEEEDLRATVRGRRIEITRRTMASEAGAITVTAPSGKMQTVIPEQTSPGVWTATIESSELGLYRFNDMTLTAVAGVGPLNSKEFSDVRSTEEILAPLIEKTGGGLFWVADPEGLSMSQAPALPDLRYLRAGRDMSGRNWIGLQQNKQYLVRSLTQTTLLIAPVALLLILASLLGGWLREGR